jgi:hypothetical protein
MTATADDIWTAIEELENDDEFQRNNDNWDFESVEVHEPVENLGAVYAIHFTKDEINIIRDHAEAVGMSTIDFIHDAAVAAAKGEGAAQLNSAVGELRAAVERATAAIAAIEANESAARERLAG